MKLPAIVLPALETLIPYCEKLLITKPLIVLPADPDARVKPLAPAPAADPSRTMLRTALLPVASVLALAPVCE